MKTSNTVQNFVTDMAINLRKEREDRSLTQSDLADLAGVSLNFISQLELGKSTARLDKVLSVLHALGLEFKISYTRSEIS